MRVHHLVLVTLFTLLPACPKKNDDKPAPPTVAPSAKADEAPAKEASKGKGKSKKSKDDDSTKTGEGDDDTPDDDDSDDDEAAAKGKKDDDSTNAGDDDAKGKKHKAAGARAIAGVDVPRWSAEPVRKDKCKPSADDQAKLAKLQKGDDASITDGSVDLDALQQDVASDCALATPKLAMALNSGGFMHYQKKKYAEANTWWARALVIDPALDVARYNLACGLALDGKDADAIWNFQQLAAAADAEDAEASNFLDKAKTDKDADSLRDEAGFTEALTHAQGGLVGPRTEPEVASALPSRLPAEWRSGSIDDGTGNEVKVTYRPTLVDVWTWRPDKDTELLVGRVVDNPARASAIGKPDTGWDNPNANEWGGIVVMRVGDDKKVELLHAHQLPYNAPYAIAAGKGGKVVYTFFYGPLGGGATSGTLSWKGGKVEAHDPTLDGA